MSLQITKQKMGIFASIIMGFIFVEDRYTKNSDIEERLDTIITTLQLRDNINFLENSRNIIQSEIERLESTLDMYNAKMVNQGGNLSISDTQRVDDLKLDLEDKQGELRATNSAIGTIRMSISPL